MRVKICGVTRLADAEMAIEAGAWAIGINNVAASPRRCEAEEAVRIGSALKRRAEVAGVFANASLAAIQRAADEQQLTMVQLHGDEGTSFCAEIARRTGCRVIKAFRVRSNADVQTAESYRVDFHLFDAHSESELGGTGRIFDWELLRGRRSAVPMIVGGGLDADNVAGAIETTHPFAVDVASGVESSPGVKDAESVRAFIAAAEQASPAEQDRGLAGSAPGKGPA